MDKALKLIITKCPHLAGMAATALQAAANGSPSAAVRYNQVAVSALRTPGLSEDERATIANAMALDLIAGRPPLHGEPMQRVSVYLRPEQIDWLKSRGEMAETVRALIDRAMADDVTP